MFIVRNVSCCTHELLKGGLKLTFHLYCIVLSAEWAEKLTEMGRGKHHLGDFLPPEELEKFMETYSVRILRSLG